MATRPRLLTRQEASRTLVNRLVSRVDRLRQRTSVRFGLRPYNVFLIWERWTGTERGEGDEIEVKRFPIVPTPKVEDLTAISLSLMSGGVLPTGSLRLTRISGTLTTDMLMGKMLPTPHEDHIPEQWEFFYEIVEDGRGDPDPVRAKFRPFSVPFRRAGQVDWTIILERVSEDRDRQDDRLMGNG